MAKRLRQILSLLCILFLTLGSAIAAGSAEEQTEARIITTEWEDGSTESDDRPDISVKFGDREAKLTRDNGWSAEISVPAGTEGDWTFTEPEGYQNRIQKVRVSDTVTILKIIAKSRAVIPSVSASVSWEDWGNAKGARPEAVQLALLADGKPFGEPTDAKAPAWKATWEKLPAYRDDGGAIVYSVSQLQTPAGYTSATNGLTVTNTLQTGRLTLTASLDGIPEGADISRLSLTVTGPDPCMPVTLSYGQMIEGTWDFGDVLPGAYLVRGTNAEGLAEGYVMDPGKSRVSDAVYVNIGESAVLTFRYAWKPAEAYEAGEEDPSANIGNLTFEILGPDPRMPMTITYAQFTDGRFELPDLVPGVYTVVERNAEELIRYYTLTGSSVTGMTLTITPGGTAIARLFNQYEPAPTPELDGEFAEFVDIPVVKTWNDRNNEDGNRPEAVTVRLYADGAEADSHVLTAAEGWRYTFTGKPRYRADKKTEIVYTVGEDAVPMYLTTVSGNTIINDYTPEVTSVSVSKVWVDNDNASKTRPSSIAMTLSDGQKVVKVVVLDKSNGWSATVSNLPTVVNGQPARYAWKEQKVLGYTLEGVEQQGSHMTFTNAIWERPEQPTQGRKPKTKGETWYVFEDYDTPLGVEVVINHVGDCFD